MISSSMSCAFHADRLHPFKRHDSGCQFADLDWPSFTVDEQEWCAFHGPMTEKNGVPSEKAEWVFVHHQTFFNEITRRRDKALALREQGNHVEDPENTRPQDFLDLTGVVFPENADFSGMTFPPVTFQQATFSGLAKFSEATFSGAVGFDSATFNGLARFSKTTFSGVAWFGKVTFSGIAGFDSVTFSRSAYFVSARFSGVAAWFTNATFGEGAIFNHSTFSGAALFETPGWTTTEDERKKNCVPHAIFTAVTFGADVFFENRQFLTGPSFADCLFTKAPIFHSCRLPQGTTFPSRECFKDVTSPKAAGAYCTLKMAVQEERERGKFYALEQQARRHHPDTPRLEKLILCLYEWTADFGENLNRPLVCLLLVTGLFVLLYASLMTLYFPAGNMDNVVASFQFAVEQVVRPFSGWTLHSGTTMQVIFKSTTLPFFLKLLSTTQSLFNLSFIGLFIFAVRRKFKLG